jgi:hypothetical protein
MKSVVSRILCVSAVVLGVAAAGAQERSASSPSNDPRVGLKAGLNDAGVAAKNMELVANLPKPPGFFDPEMPAGAPTGPETPEPKPGEKPQPQTEKPAPPAKPGEKPAPARNRGSALDFANSDLAFQGDRLFIGNFSGFNVYDIASPRNAKLIASVVCPGGQGDVSIYKNLLIMSVEQTRGRVDCGTEGVQEPVSAERFRGVRIFDISDIRKPKQIAAVQTCRGSHTHTLLESPNDTENIYIYGSGTGTPRSPEELAGCSDKKPEDDPNTSML